MAVALQPNVSARTCSNGRGIKQRTNLPRHYTTFSVRNHIKTSLFIPSCYVIPLTSISGSVVKICQRISLSPHALAGDSVPLPEGETTKEEPSSGSSKKSGDQSNTSNDVVLPPWNLGKVVQVLSLWWLAYVVLGQVAVPVALELLGIDRAALSTRGHALLHLALDFTQLAVTLGIMHHCLAEFQPRQRGMFPVRLPGWWPVSCLAGALCFPGIDWLANQSVALLEPQQDTFGERLEQSLSLGDWFTNLLYFAVVSLCAPVWEEALFRGFLLPSLMKVMPPAAAVLCSSLVFALCHFKSSTFLPLLALGLIFSVLFLRTNNLLPPILLHSLWNVFVLYGLIFKS